MSKRFLIFWLLVIIIWVVMLLYAFWLMIASAGVMVSGENMDIVLAQPLPPTAAATPTALPTLILLSVPTRSLNLVNTPINSTPITNLPPTPPPGSTVLLLTPQAEAVGWTSSIDGKNHFGDGKIHVGFFRGHVYHGAIQFDLSDIPPGSNISYATLELTGLSDRNLGPGGVWQVRLLDTALDQTWFALTYDKLRQGNIASTLQPVLPRESLAKEATHIFPLNEKQLTILMERLNTGRISFRIDGPSTGLDNLFTWDNRTADQTEEFDDSLTEEELLALNKQPVLRVVIEALKYVVVTSTPTPENILTVAAQVDSDIAPTPLPAHWVTPVVVTSMPPPANEATATFQAQVATAEAVVYGTATPTPINMWTATPTSALVPLPEGVPTSSIPPTATPAPIPQELIGKIAFLSDRADGSENGQPLAYVMDADGSAIALLTGQVIYETVVARDRFATYQEFLAFSRDVKQEDGKQQSAIFLYDYLNNKAEQITWFQSSMAYQPAWSPTQARIAFVSDDSGTEEIWAINHNRTDLQQLTRDDPVALDGHPSWSPDGSQIVFWSDRTGNRQIWVMNADGSNPRLLHQNSFNDWDPVWIKYTDFVIRPVPEE